MSEQEQLARFQAWFAGNAPFVHAPTDWMEPLGDPPPFGRDDVEFLVEMLFSDSLAVAWQAGLALAVVDAPAEAVVVDLANMLDHDNGVVRRHARWVLHARGSSVVPELARLWREDDRGLRDAIAEALAFFGPAAAPALAIVRDVRVEAAVHGPVEPLACPLSGLSIYVEPPESELDVDRRVWTHTAQSVASWAADSDGLDLERVLTWTKACEARHAERLDQWQPGCIAVARPEVTLRWEDGGRECSRRLVARSATGFTCAELAWLALGCMTSDGELTDRYLESIESLGSDELYAHLGS